VGALAALGTFVFGPLAIGPAARWEGFLRNLPAALTLGDANPSGLGLALVLAQHLAGPGRGTSVLAHAAWAAYAVALLGISIPFLRRAWRTRDPRLWVTGAAFLYLLLAPRPMAYGFVLLGPAPLFLAPRPFDKRRGRLLLSLALSAQGLTRATGHHSDTLEFLYAPFLLTLCLWLLIARSAAHGAPGVPAAQPSPAVSG